MRIIYLMIWLIEKLNRIHFKFTNGKVLLRGKIFINDLMIIVRMIINA